MNSTSDNLLNRIERFTRLADVCPALATALEKNDPSPDRTFLAFKELVQLECSQCHTIVAGAELFVLSQPSEGNDLSPALRRLRLGFCANTSCQSFDCKLTFKPAGGIDWPTCLDRVDSILLDLENSRAGRSKAWLKQLLRPALIVLVALVLLLLLRQLYTGGRIPLLREPEKFRVTPATESFQQR